MLQGRLLRGAVAALIVGLFVATASGQGFRGQGRRGGNRFFEPFRTPTAESFDGAFTFCRIAFPGSPDGDGGGWSVDYPRADVNLSIRLSELTKTRISRQTSGEPNHLVMTLDNPALFNCPFIMMTEVGAVDFPPPQAAKLREYLLKGGFLWADDFWGSYAWDHWVREFSNVLPPGEYPIKDVPANHPIFHGQFESQLIQIPAIGNWGGPGGNTSERGWDSAEPHFRGVSDSQGRLLVVITHNTDYGDAFEREAEDPRYFYTFSVAGYALGIDILLYSMTH